MSFAQASYYHPESDFAEHRHCPECGALVHWYDGLVCDWDSHRRHRCDGPTRELCEWCGDEIVIRPNGVRLDFASRTPHVRCRDWRPPVPAGWSIPLREPYPGEAEADASGPRAASTRPTLRGVPVQW